MDHNEERRQDEESWDLHRETVNKFIRLAYFLDYLSEIIIIYFQSVCTEINNV